MQYLLSFTLVLGDLVDLRLLLRLHGFFDSRENGRRSEVVHLAGQLVRTRLNRHSGAMESEGKQSTATAHVLVANRELALGDLNRAIKGSDPVDCLP